MILSRVLLALFAPPLLLAVHYPDLPSTAALQPLIDEQSYILPACPAAGVRPELGSAVSPIMTLSDLQKAAAAATNGAVICLGAQIVGNVTFNKSNTVWVTVRSASADPAARRAMSTDTGFGITTATGSPAITIGGAAKRYRFVGLNITTSLNQHLGQQVLVGPTNVAPSNCELIHFDRNRIHGAPGYTTAEASKGISVYSCKSVLIERNRIWDFRGGSVGGDPDTNAILLITSPGQILIENNYLEASGENLMIGGGALFAVATDIVIRGNLFEKITSQRTNMQRYQAKNLLEFKHGNRVLVEGNIFRNFWSGVSNQQHAIPLKATTQNCGVSGWDLVHTSNITIRYNKLINFSNGFMLGKVAPACANGNNYLGGDTYHIHNNTFQGWGQWSNRFSGNAIEMFSVSLPKPSAGANRKTVSDITIENNTLVDTGTTLPGNSRPWLRAVSACMDAVSWCFENGLTFRNNVMGAPNGVPGGGTPPQTGPGLYSQNGDRDVVTMAEWNTYFTDSVITSNLGMNSTANQPMFTAPNYPVTGSYTANVFTNYAAGDYTLKAPYSALVGTDSQPLGANIAVVNACTAGADDTWTGSSGCPGATGVSVNLTANGSTSAITVASGASVVNAWTLSGTTSCTKSATCPDTPASCTAWSGSVTASGSQTLNPTANTVYTLTCTGAPSSASVTVNIDTPDQPGVTMYTAPTSGSINQPLPVTLEWNAPTDAEEYDVYMGTTGTPTTLVGSGIRTTCLVLGSAATATCSEFSSSSLSATTTYYWRVVAFNGTRARSTNGEAPWSFTTGTTVTVLPPDAPTYISPSAGATNVPRPTELKWNAAPRATSYDIYVGITNPPPLFTEWSGTSRLFMTLSPSTHYYWKIAAKNSAAPDGVSGTIQDFTTAPDPIGCESPPPVLRGTNP